MINTLREQIDERFMTGPNQTIDINRKELRITTFQDPHYRTVFLKASTVQTTKEEIVEELISIKSRNEKQAGTLTDIELELLKKWVWTQLHI